MEITIILLDISVFYDKVNNKYRRALNEIPMKNGNLRKKTNFIQEQKF